MRGSECKKPPESLHFRFQSTYVLFYAKQCRFMIIFQQGSNFFLEVGLNYRCLPVMLLEPQHEFRHFNFLLRCGGRIEAAAISF